MALFTSAEGAILAGYDIMENIDTLNEKRAVKEKDAIHIGLAVNAGPVMLGPVGDSKRMAATGVVFKVKTC